MFRKLSNIILPALRVKQHKYYEKTRKWYFLHLNRAVIDINYNVIELFRPADGDTIVVGGTETSHGKAANRFSEEMRFSVFNALVQTLKQYGSVNRHERNGSPHSGNRTNQYHLTACSYCFNSPAVPPTNYRKDFLLTTGK